MIYLDHAATSPLSRPVLGAMWPYLTDVFGNPSSHHELGRQALAGLEAARTAVARILNCGEGEIIFTSGGTEANNLAVKGIALANPKGRHVVTTAVEHKAILETCDALQRDHDFRITVVPVDHDGVVDVDVLVQALTEDTTLCTVMYANNDVGTVQPIADIATRCQALGVPFHTDAVQAAGLLPLDVKSLDVAAMSLSAHKFGGPKGVGALYVSGRIPLTAMVDGGGQEAGRRSGTHNVASAVGLATALTLAEGFRPSAAPRLTELRDRLINGVLGGVPQALLTGHRTNRLANHASFCFSDISGEAVLQELELSGVCCSSGSACAAGSDDASHVLVAMGYDDDLARTAVRFTLGPNTTDDEIDQVVAFVPQAVEAVGGLSRR